MSTYINPEQPYQINKPQSPEDFEALKRSIAENGQFQPILMDDQGHILAGHTRMRACRDLGVEPDIRVLSGLTEDQKWALVYEESLTRRNLNRAERQAMIESYVRKHPDQSTAKIARLLKMSAATVKKYRTKIEEREKYERYFVKTGLAYLPEPPDGWLADDEGFNDRWASMFGWQVGDALLQVPMEDVDWCCEVLDLLPALAHEWRNAAATYTTEAERAAVTLPGLVPHHSRGCLLAEEAYEKGGYSAINAASEQCQDPQHDLKSQDKHYSPEYTAWLDNMDLPRRIYDEQGRVLPSHLGPPAPNNPDYQG